MPGSIATQVFEFCGTGEFGETLQNSEVTSSSHCYYDENSAYTANLSFPSNLDKIDKYSTQLLDQPNTLQNDPNENFNASTTTSGSATTATTLNNNNSFSIIFDSQDEFDNDISASIDFSASPPFSSAPYLSINYQDQLDFPSVENGVQLSQYSDPVIPFMGPPLPCVYQEDCLNMMPPLFLFNPSAPASYSFFDPSMGSFLHSSVNASLDAESSGIYSVSMLVGSENQPKERECHVDSNGMFSQDQLQRVYNSNDTQSISNDNQQLVSRAGSTSLSTEISNLEDSSFKPGKLSPEERKEKIHRYMKKRNERNFNKKIKYACRKTLADSRPRVRGRFAKNDDLGDANKHDNNHQQENVFDEVRACVSSLLHYQNF